MHISGLTIRNFRNFHKASFVFTKGVNTLIGENGAGKSNALYAIRLLIDDTLSRRAIRLSEDDFARVLPAWRGHWIVIALDFNELDLSEGCQVIRHGLGHAGDPGAGRLTLLFRPTIEARTRLFQASRDGGPAAAQAELAGLALENYESGFTGRAGADFLDDDVYRSVAGDVEGGVFPDPSEEDVALVGTATQGLHQEVTCTFVKALRDVVADLRSARSNPLLALLRGAEKTIAVEDAAGITAAVKGLNADIAGLKEIQAVANGVRSTMLAAIGRTYAPEVDISSELPDDVEHLLQHLALRIGEDSGHRGDVADVGLGGANLVFIALKLLEYELKLASDRVAHFLLIEEPEAHIHPHVQRTLFEKYRAKRTQVIVSSHSTHLSSVASIRSMNVLARRGNHAAVFSPSNGLTDAECSRTERYLDAVRSTLLFAKGVILVEGDAEAILIPTIVRAAFGVGMDELGVSVVSVGGAVFRQLAPLFHPDRIQRPCSVVTDLDAPLATLPADPSHDTTAQKRHRRAAKLGASRRDELAALCNGNRWLGAFFAPTTFEVEFLRAGNAAVVVDVVAGQVSKGARLKRARERLESDDIQTAGTEILRIAKAVGKGWFALLLADRIKSDVETPRYLLEALAFASRETVDLRTLRAMGAYRLEAKLADQSLLKLADHRLASDEEFVREYLKAFPIDLLSQLSDLQRKARDG